MTKQYKVAIDSPIYVFGEGGKLVRKITGKAGQIIKLPFLRFGQVIKGEEINFPNKKGGKDIELVLLKDSISQPQRFVFKSTLKSL